MAYRYNKESYYQESAAPRRGINGGPGRTRTFDLPIMSPAGRVYKPTETAVCRSFRYISVPYSLQVVRAKCVFSRVFTGNSVQLLLVTSGPYQSPCKTSRR